MKTILTIATATALTAPYLLGSTIDQEFQQTAKKVATHVMSAVKIAEQQHDTQDKNFVALAKSLRSLDFGGIPAPPPHAQHGQDHKDKNVDKRVLEDRKKEMAQRMKMIGEMNKEFLQALDVDKDLTISAQEVEQAVSGYLKFKLNDMLKVDKNKDRRLTLAEYALAVPAKGKLDKDGFDWHQRGHFEHDDKNNDGFLDLNEMISHTATIMVERACLVHVVLKLTTADKNSNGKITHSEFIKLSDQSSTVWKKFSPAGNPIELKHSYTSLYWLPMDQLTVILK